MLRDWAGILWGGGLVLTGRRDDAMTCGERWVRGKGSERKGRERWGGRIRGRR